MGVQVKNIVVLVILLVISSAHLSLAQINCLKFDFDRTTFPEFGICQSKNQPNFVIKSYATQNDLKPFRSNAKYYLTNNFYDTYSCAESIPPYTLKVNPTSVIEVAVNLKSNTSSFLEIVLYDADRNERVDSIRTDGTNGWQIIHKNIRKTIQNARIEIDTFMKQQSVLGIEYVNIVDTAIKTDECTPTYTNQKKSLPRWAWILIGCGIAAALIAICTGIYCAYNKRRNNMTIGGNK